MPGDQAKVSGVDMPLPAICPGCDLVSVYKCVTQGFIHLQFKVLNERHRSQILKGVKDFDNNTIPLHTSVCEPQGDVPHRGRGEVGCPLEQF